MTVLSQFFHSVHLPLLTIMEDREWDLLGEEKKLIDTQVLMDKLTKT